MKKPARKNPGGGKNRRDRWLAAGLAAMLLAAAFWTWFGDRGTARRAAATAEVHERLERGTPLSPALFVGQTARAYRVAHEIPAVLDQLYCYCECDKHLGHKTLLSCFIDSHAAT